MNITRRQVLMLLPAAAVAWEYVLAGTPEAAPNYDRTQHWWGMLIDISKCIGCGNCVRACAEENHVPEGYFRTWVERYHVDDWPVRIPRWTRRMEASAVFRQTAKAAGRIFLCLKCAITVPILLVRRCARRGHVCHPRWGCAGRSEILPRLPLLRAGVSVRMPLYPPHQTRSQKNAHFAITELPRD